jgi:hypothetical protein
VVRAARGRLGEGGRALLGRGAGELEGVRAVVEPGGEQEEGMELLGRSLREQEEDRWRTLVAWSPGGELGGGREVLGGSREVLARRERESSPIIRRDPRRLEERIRLRDAIREQSGSRDLVARVVEGEQEELEGRPAKRARTDTGQVLLALLIHLDTISAVSSSPASSRVTWRRPSGGVSRSRRSPA